MAKLKATAMRISALVLGVATNAAQSYEFSTHALLTREAYYASHLFTDSTALLASLGILDRSSNLGDQYVDMLSGHVSSRSMRPGLDSRFAQRKIDAADLRGRSRAEPQSLVSWLMQGAVREDDVTLSAGDVEDTPQDDPGGNFDRVLNHFYDPSEDRSLTVGIGLGVAAPRWALDGGPAAKENRFSLRFAKEALWRAVTLTQIDASGTPVPVVIPDGLRSRGSQITETHRSAYWATLFRSLGSVVHLLQDMAQPQHTRNDAHSGYACLGTTCAGGHASYYENYVEARATKSRKFALRERLIGALAVTDVSEAVALDPVLTSGYDIPDFSSYDDYFSTDTHAASVSGRGLANFSNQAFYSAGTNIGLANGNFYGSPPRSPASPLFTVQTLSNGNVRNAVGNNVSGTATLFRADLRDNNQSAAADLRSVALTTFSAFNARMQPTGNYAFTLNHYNYDDQARILLPRAVAYSAGMLNRVFRNHLSISAPPTGLIGIAEQTKCGVACAFPALRLMVGNASATEAIQSGIFVAVATFHRNGDYTNVLSGEPGGSRFRGYAARDEGESISVSDAIASSSLPGGKLGPDGQQVFDFHFPDGIPVQATDLSVQVVFRGTLGGEADAVVVGSLNISEPTFHGFANITDYVWDMPTSKFRPLPVGRYTTTDDTLNIKLRFGSATSPVVASIPKLSAGQHAQIATLTDRTTNTIYVESQSANWLNASPVPVDFPAAEFYSPPNSMLYDANMKVNLRRGVYRQNYFFWGLPADGTLYSCTPANERCVQATLPALSPTNTVPWTITF